MSSFAIGDKFQSLSAFKNALIDIAVKENFVTKIERSDRTRAIVICRSTIDCPFRVRCNWNPVFDLAVVSGMILDHTCLGTAPVIQNPASSLAWLSKELPKLLAVSQNTSTKDIIDIIKKRHGHAISDRQAQRVREFLLNNNFSVHANDFRKLPAYLEALEKVNERLYTDLSIRADHETFHCIFICPTQSETTFSFSLPFIALDGTFLKTQFRQTLLFAVGRDLNNQIYLLAWAVVESENESSWRYFISHLKQAIPSLDEPSTVVMSDRDKGLQAASNEWVHATQGWCSHHIKANVIKYHGEAAGTAFMRMAKATSESGWNSALDTLAQTRNSQRAIEYVNAIDKSKWATLHFPQPRYGHITSNIVEQMNIIFRTDRELPTVELLDNIWIKYKEMRSQRYIISQVLQNSVTQKQVNNVTLTPFAHGRITENINYSRYNTVAVGDPEKLEGRVVQQDGQVFIVNVQENRCSCLKFQDVKLTCGHAIALIHKLKQPIPEDAFDTFWVGLYQCAYYGNVTQINISELQPEAVPVAPPAASAPRRPTKKRRERGFSGAKLTKRARAEMDGMLG